MDFGFIFVLVLLDSVTVDGALAAINVLSRSSHINASVAGDNGLPVWILEPSDSENKTLSLFSWSPHDSMELLWF